MSIAASNLKQLKELEAEISRTDLALQSAGKAFAVALHRLFVKDYLWDSRDLNPNRLTFYQWVLTRPYGQGKGESAIRYHLDIVIKSKAWGIDLFDGIGVASARVIASLPVKQESAAREIFNKVKVANISTQTVKQYVRTVKATGHAPKAITALESRMFIVTRSQSATISRILGEMRPTYPNATDGELIAIALEFWSNAL